MDTLLQALSALLGHDRPGCPHISSLHRSQPAAEPADAPTGCGWFDSSHELASGLRVQELATSDALAELPLGSWLELELAACVDAMAPKPPSG